MNTQRFARHRRCINTPTVCLGEFILRILVFEAKTAFYLFGPFKITFVSIKKVTYFVSCAVKMNYAPTQASGAMLHDGPGFVASALASQPCGNGHPFDSEGPGTARPHSLRETS